MQENKEKVAFVVVRYGKDINGGAEYHCQMLAERLTSEYDVEVLTTCVRNAETGKNEYEEGNEYWNGVLIRRFKADPIHPENEKRYAKAAKPARKWRRFLYRIRLLAPLSYLHPLWEYKQKDEIQAMNASIFYSSGLKLFVKNIVMSIRRSLQCHWIIQLFIILPFMRVIKQLLFQQCIMWVFHFVRC